MPDPDPAPTQSVLFVCLGNICRSPLAEGIMAHLAGEAGLGDRLRVDSAGTGGWHVGEPADPRSVEVAERHGISLPSRARQVTPEDLAAFDLVVAMDGSNLESLESLGAQIPEGADAAELRRLREFDPQADGDLDVPDPYYGGPDGFDRVYDMVHRSCRTLLDELGARLDG